VNQAMLAEMIGTTLPRVNFFQHVSSQLHKKSSAARASQHREGSGEVPHPLVLLSQ